MPWNGSKEGDERALEWFVKRYTPYVGAVVWAVIGGRLSVQDGEEIAADVFLAAVDALGEPDKEIFLRRYYFGQSAPAIGEKLNMKAEAVRQRLKRGRDAIRATLVKGE